MFGAALAPKSKAGDLKALCRKSNTSERHRAHLAFPQVQCGLAVERASLVWALDITYLVGPAKHPEPA